MFRTALFTIEDKEARRSSKVEWIKKTDGVTMEYYKALQEWIIATGNKIDESQKHNIVSRI